MQERACLRTDAGCRLVGTSVALRRRAWLQAFILLVCLRGVCFGLINPKYTPVDLFEGSSGIVVLELTAGNDDSSVSLFAERAIKGEPKLPASAKVSEAALDATQENPMPHGKAVLFLGDFKGASLEGADSQEAVGALCTSAGWFGVTGGAADSGFVLVSDKLDLRSVWAGDAGMLAALCAEIASSPSRASVPTSAGLKPGRALTGPEIGMNVRALVPVLIAGKGRYIFAASPEGDRMLGWEADSGLVDVSSEFSIGSSSEHAAWIDLTGDGVLDLVSASGRNVALYVSEKAGFSKAGAVQLDAEVLNLSPVGLSVACGTEAGVFLVSRSEGGELAAERLTEAAGPCGTADFTGDGREDIVQVTSSNIVLLRGKEAGFHAPVVVFDGLEKDMFGAPVIGDFDADGVLDLMTSGLDGAEVFRNVGDKFLSLTSGSGEMRYIARPEIVSASAADINADGRQEFVFFYKDGGILPFFSRGFFCFGFAAELELRSAGLPGVESLMQGQQAGVVCDIDGDGMQDIVAVGLDGIVVSLHPEPAVESKQLSLELMCSPGTNRPVAAVAGDRVFQYGAQKIETAFPAFIGVRRPGPVDLLFRYPGNNTRKERVIVLKPVRFEVPDPNMQ